MFSWIETAVSCIIGLHDVKVKMNFDDDKAGKPDKASTENPMNDDADEETE